MTIVVWVDAWQMQCCGDPFRVGLPVSWHLMDPDLDSLTTVLGPIADTVTHAEEHHLQDPADLPEATTGAVQSIRAVFSRFSLRPGDDSHVSYADATTTVIEQVEVADGWDRETDGRMFVGYLVELDVT